jgi:hypothetical protein
MNFVGSQHPQTKVLCLEVGSRISWLSWYVPLATLVNLFTYRNAEVLIDKHKVLTSML